MVNSALCTVSKGSDTDAVLHPVYAVAPANPSKLNMDAELSLEPLPTPAKLVTSAGDPWLSRGREH